MLDKEAKGGVAYWTYFEHTAIIAPISAAFPMVTIILARIYFKENLYINQKIGIVFVVIGLVSLSI